MDNYRNKSFKEISIIEKGLRAQGWNELTIPFGIDAKDAAKYIIKSKTEGYYAYMGMKWYANFNGIIFYSTDELTERDIFTAIYGYSPEEHDLKEKERFEKIRKDEEEFKQKIPQIISEYIEKGHKILPQEHHALWDEIVPIRVNDLYHGMELQAALDIIEILNGDDFEKAKKKFYEQGHSGMSASITRAIIKAFSNNGELFCKMIA